MLVLARRPDETIHFPALGIEVRILRVQGNLVRVGIEAPRDVHILRGEIPADSTAARSTTGPRKSELSHALRNRLNKISLRLHLLQRQLQVGECADADRALAEAIDMLSGLDLELTHSAEGKTPSARERAPRYRVLVVEDDANERELLAGILSMNGCECDTAADGLAALERLRSGAMPDFVLLDMRMPRCDGPRTLQRIRKSSRLNGLPIFAVSGTTRGDLGIDMGGQGVDAWFAKPLDPRQLWDAMQQYRRQVVEAN